MSEKTDATFLFALIILTLVGLAISSVAHAEDALPQMICPDQNGANCGAAKS